MNNFQNSANRRSSISASLSKKEKFQSQTKPQGPLVTMTVIAATPSRCIALILMATSHQRIGRRISDHLRKKGTREPLIRDSLSTIREAAHQVMTAVVANAHTHSDLRIACFMVLRPIIAPKIAPYSSSLREKWTRDPTSIRHKQHLEKSTTPCYRLPTTRNILHLSPRISHHKPTKTFKPKPWLITNHTTMPQLITRNLRQPHK
jgi:hypothetical protein